MSAPELVVLLDEAGAAVGTAAKSTVHHRDTPLHLAFSCYVLDSAGRVLLTRRADTKVTWPGVWTNACCGHPAPGEPVPDAVRRRLVDELGLRLPPGADALRLVLPRFRYRAQMADGVVEHEMCPVYVATSDDDPVPAPAEVGAWERVDWGAFRADVLAGVRPVSPWCREQVAALPEDLAGAPVAAEADLPPAARTDRSA